MPHITNDHDSLNALFQLEPKPASNDRFRYWFFGNPSAGLKVFWSLPGRWKLAIQKARKTSH